MASAPIIGDRFYIACTFFFNMTLFWHDLRIFSCQEREKKIIPRAIQDKPYFPISFEWKYQWKFFQYYSPSSFGLLLVLSF